MPQSLTRKSFNNTEYHCQHPGASDLPPDSPTGTLHVPRIRWVPSQTPRPLTQNPGSAQRTVRLHLSIYMPMICILLIIYFNAENTFRM